MSQKSMRQEETPAATQIRVERFVDREGMVSVNGVMVNAPSRLAGRFVYVYLPEMRIVPAPARVSRLSEKRRLFLWMCHVAGLNPADFPAGASHRDVIVRHKQVFEASQRQLDAEVIEIDTAYEANPANLMRVLGRGTPDRQVGGADRL